MIPTSDVLILLASVILVQTVFLSVSWLESIWIGWKDLAESYPLAGPAEGRVWKRQRLHIRKSGRLGEPLYANVGASRRGLQLQFCWAYTRWPVRLPWCGDVLIPWGDATAARLPRRSRIPVEFHFERQPRVTIRMSEPLAREIAAEVGGQWSAGDFLLDKQPEEARTKP